MSSHRPILNAAAILAAFALAGVGLVNWVQSATAERIAASQRQSLLRTLEALVPPSDYDNDLVTDVVEVQDSSLGGKAPVYRARQRGRPVALVVGARAPDGYNGEIKMLVAVRADGSLLGVRVIEHRETPGLGDGIELEKSGWIRGFDGLSLNDPPERSWRVKRDGGSFDQFTGATITPRAVVKAVKNVLLYV
ncbi:MAG: electron transport complex subunit RsxG, partial [Methylococcaceae bacterium]|nr:electron transport complex subunit RsxG [Methylococcaceae bacterium]